MEKFKEKQPFMNSEELILDAHQKVINQKLLKYGYIAPAKKSSRKLKFFQKKS